MTIETMQAALEENRQAAHDIEHAVARLYNVLGVPTRDENVPQGSEQAPSSFIHACALNLHSQTRQLYAVRSDVEHLMEILTGTVEPEMPVARRTSMLGMPEKRSDGPL